MKSIVQNLEYCFWCFISFTVQGVFRVGGGHFQHVLGHILSYIYYMQKCHWIFHAPGLSFQMNSKYVIFHDMQLLKFWHSSFIAVSHVLQITSMQKVSLLLNSNTVVARHLVSCQNWVRSGEVDVLCLHQSTYITEIFNPSITTTLIFTSDIKIQW